MKRFIFLLTACATLVAAVPAAHAADAFPAKPLTLVVPFPPGGPTDAMARTLAAEMKDRLGQPMIVENRAGAGGNIGAEYVARAEADGHTLMFGTSGPLAINKSLYRKINYDPVKSFAPVIQVGYLPNILVVNPALPVKTVPELVALARSKPGALNFGSSGIGSTNHLAGELLKRMTGIDIVHVPYKGAAPAMNDLIAGHIPMMFDNMPAVLPQVQGGSVRAIAVAGAKRATALPDVPTVAEQGVPGFEAFAWFGMVAPAKTPADVLGSLQREVETILKMPDVQKRFAELGADPGTVAGADFGKFLADDRAKWTKIIQASGASAE